MGFVGNEKGNKRDFSLDPLTANKKYTEMLGCAALHDESPAITLKLLTQLRDRFVVT